MDWEVGIGTAEDDDKVVFESNDGSFGCGCVVTMQMWWGQLEVNGFDGQEFVWGCRGFVIEALELGAEAMGDKELMYRLVGSDDGLGS
jgi:hypothetical protein